MTGEIPPGDVAVPDSAVRSVRIHGGRVDHDAREGRPGWWQMLCGFLPVYEDDFARPLCGTPCTACTRALAKATDPAATALRAHEEVVRRRESTGQSPLPGGGPTLRAGAGHGGVATTTTRISTVTEPGTLHTLARGGSR